MKLTQLIPIFLSLILLSACASPASATPTPTQVDINALQTAVVQTVVANITQTAAAQPTLAATNTPVPAAVTQPAATAGAVPTAATPALVPTATTLARCDDAVFVSDASVADGTHMGPGQAFVKTWRVKNIGTCTWKTTYHVSYGFGDKMSGLPTALPAEVLPGQETEISVNLTAPQKAANYFANWRLTNASGIFFGQGLTVMIIVP